MCGGTALKKKGWPDWRIARAGPGAAPLGHVHRLSAGSSLCVKTGASARPASPASWAPRPQRCTGSWFVAGSTASTTWTGRQGSQSAGSRCPDPASSSISTSKSWAGSQKVEAGASTVEWLARQPIARRKAAIGYAYVHSAVDGYSRLAYSEVLANEQAATTIGFWLRAQAFFAAHDIRIERVLTDNGPCYRAKEFAVALGDVRHTFTRPYRPATNGKVERFNRTLLVEWAYAQPWHSEGQRTQSS